MATQYLSNIKIADLTLTMNPGQYEQKWKKLGFYGRTIGGGIIDVVVNGTKLILNVKGIAQAQVEEIKKRAVLNKELDFIDYIPIAEKDQQTRIVQEDLGSETIDGELIYLYIPSYKIVIFDFFQKYANNVMSYTITGEEV